MECLVRRDDNTVAYIHKMHGYNPKKTDNPIIGKLLKLKYRINDTATTEGGWSTDMQSDKAYVMNLISDISSSGETIKSNNLRILKDGIILKSQACFFLSKKNKSKMDIKKTIRLFT